MIVMQYDDLPVTDVLPIVYVCLSLSLLLLTASLLTLSCLRRLRSNSNSIHVHLLATVCATYFVFLIGIDKVYVEVRVKSFEEQTMCKVRVLSEMFSDYFFIFKKTFVCAGDVSVHCNSTALFSGVVVCVDVCRESAHVSHVG
jgi:hypothetical protein